MVYLMLFLIKIIAFAQVNKMKQAQAKWNEAKSIIDSMKEGQEYSWAVRSLGSHLSTVKKYDDLLLLIQQSWLHAQTREDAKVLFPLVSSIISLHPSIGVKLHEVFNLVDGILKES